MSEIDAQQYGAEPARDYSTDLESDDVARFVAVTNCPPEQAQFFLQAAGGFERAVTLFFGEQLAARSQLQPANLLAGH